MADESEKWLQQQKLVKQTSKDRWPYADAGSPGRSRRDEHHQHQPRKPSTGELSRPRGAGREGPPSQDRGSKHQEEEYLGSDSAAHQQPAGATESTDVRPPEAEGEGEGEGGPSREESSWVNIERPRQPGQSEESMEPALRSLRKAEDELKQQLDAALKENAEMGQQVEEARTRAHEVNERYADSQRKELELQQHALRDAKQRHQFEIKSLRDTYEQKLRQKDREKTFSQDQNPALQGLEAHYQQKLQEQERSWHQREQGYRKKIDELQSYQQQMTRTEFEVRAETERLREELDHKEVELSLQSIRIGPREGETETRDIGWEGPEDLGDVRQLRTEVGLKDVEIEDLRDQMTKKDERIAALNQVIQKNTETAKRGLRSGDVDIYTEQVTRLTAQLSEYDTADKEQKKELAKLRQKVERVGEIEQQLQTATIQMSQYEADNRSLRDKMAAVDLKTASGGGVDDSQTAQLERELQRLRPLEGEVQRLNAELERSKHYHHMAKDFQLQISALKHEIQQRAQTIVELESQRPMASVPEKTEAEMQFLRQQLSRKEEEIAQLRSEVVGSAGGDVGHLRRQSEVAELQKQLHAKNQEIAQLRGSGKATVDSITVQELAGTLAQVRHETALKDREIARLKTEKERLESSASDKTSGDVQSHQVKELHRLLKEKDDKVTKLTHQLQQFEKTATDLTKIVQHSKDQSRAVMELKEQLERSESERCLLQSHREQETVEMSPEAPKEVDTLQKTQAGLESSLTASQSENETLKARNAQFDIQLRRMQATNAELQSEVASLREKQRDAAVAADMARERDHLQQKIIHMQARIQNLEHDVHQSKQQVFRHEESAREKGRELQRLTREKEELRNDLEIERVKALTFQEDFQQERKDRESAHNKVAEMETRYTHQLQTMSTELVRTTSELDAHKKNLVNTEAVMQKRAQQMRQQMAEKEHELGLKNQEIARLREEVQSKAQQVKQYKKQADKYRQEMEPFVQQGVMQKEQVEFFARQAEEVKHHNAGLKQELEKLSREAVRREAFERRAAELEGENNQLRQNIRSLQVENDHLRRHLRTEPSRQEQPPPPRSAFGPPPGSAQAPPTSSTLPPPTRPPHSVPVEGSQRQGQTLPLQYPHHLHGDSHPRQPQRQMPPAAGYSFEEQRMVQSRVSTTDNLPAPTRSAAIRAQGANPMSHYSQPHLPPAPNGYSARGLPPRIQMPSAHGNFNGQAPPHHHHHPGPPRNEGQGLLGAHPSGLNSLPPGFTPGGLGAGEHPQRPLPPPRTQDDSNVNVYPSQDSVEKDSPPTSTVGSQAQQVQQQYLLKQQQQLATAGNSGRSNAAAAKAQRHGREGREPPSTIHPRLPLGRTSQPESQPLSSPPHYKSHMPAVHSKAGATSPIMTVGDWRPESQAHKYPVQETQPITQVPKMPASKGTTYTYARSQPVPSSAVVAPKTAPQSGLNTVQESNSLLKGIDGEIHRAAKNVKTKVRGDLSSPAFGDDVPFDPNLVCPFCRVQFRLGEIQKFRKHVEICHKTKK